MPCRNVGMIVTCLRALAIVGERINIDEEEERPTARRVDELMGRNPEKRMQFIQEHAALVDDRDLDI